jgi:hypothetical protein
MKRACNSSDRCILMYMYDYSRHYDGTTTVVRV